MQLNNLSKGKHPGQEIGHFSLPRSPFFGPLPNGTPPSCSKLTTTLSFMIVTSCFSVHFYNLHIPVFRHHINKVMWYVLSGARLLSQDIMLLNHPGWYVDCTSFSLLNDIPLYEYIPIYWPFYCQWTFGLFSVWGYLNKTARNIHKQVSVGSISRRVLLDHGGTCMFNSNRYHQMIFQSDCMTLHSHQHCMGVPVAPHPCQFLVLSKV